MVALVFLPDPTDQDKVSVRATDAQLLCLEESSNMEIYAWHKQFSRRGHRDGGIRATEPHS